jgi:DNA-binding NtrC family response regulator
MTERILIVDDDADHSLLLSAMLTRTGYAVETRTSAEEAIELVGSQGFSAILTDVEMTEMSGLALCERLTEIAPHIPVIVVTGRGNLEVVVDAIRAGAFDYLAKPVEQSVLNVRLERAVRHGRIVAELRRLRQGAENSLAQDALICGSSRGMGRVLDLVERVATSDASVLIQGETGTGKELVARAIHAASPRASGPFVAINCAAVPPALLESELFGHAKGAFTDAKTDRTGLFQQASGGTLFLDEIGEMPLEMQAKLLRALQERVVRPVGGHGEVKFDVRVLAATHRNLEADLLTKRFREDLFYRINVVGIQVPPLRARPGEILLLASHFLDRFCKRSGRSTLQLSAPVAQALVTYEWPGNVRELENCVERMVALARFDETSLADLPEHIRGSEPGGLNKEMVDRGDIVPWCEMEERHIHRALKRASGNKSLAAQMLGLDRRTLYRKLDRLGKGTDSTSEATVEDDTAQTSAADFAS